MSFVAGCHAQTRYCVVRRTIESLASGIADATAPCRIRRLLALERPAKIHVVTQRPEAINAGSLSV